MTKGFNDIAHVPHFQWIFCSESAYSNTVIWWSFCHELYTEAAWFFSPEALSELRSKYVTFNIETDPKYSPEKQRA